MPAPDDLATETDHASTSKPSAVSQQPAKQMLGRYEIESVLGSGGMGIVYAAFDHELQRRVAVKVLADANRSQVASERLLREARAMARLTHPNVVRVYEVDTCNGQDLVAMELVDGETLAEWMHGGKRTRDEIVARFVAAGRGLVAAHEAGVVHRDFKPQNVLCSKDERILVTDFGLAREIDAPTSDGVAVDGEPPIRKTLEEITAAGSVVGTIAYMAPEQHRGSAVGPAADQFSFCVALWEALTGARPYRGTREQIMAAHERGPESLDASALPRRLRAPLLRGLAIDPEQRWPSIAALLRRLTKRSRRVTALIAAIAVVGIATVVGFAVGSTGRGDVCTAPILDPSSVWSPATSAQFGEKQRGIARMIDRDVASWRNLRTQACKEEPKIREAKLACLDGVISRLDALVHAANAGATTIYGEELVEPAICNIATPPRLPRAASPEFRDALAYVAQERAKSERLSPAVLAELDGRAKADPCARAFAAYTHAKSVDEPAAFKRVLRESELLAEECGDDYLRASVLVYGGAADSDDEVSKQRGQQARAAVARVPATDLQGKVELLDVYEAMRDKRTDDAIAHAESAIARFETRGCISCAAHAALTAVGLRDMRATPADLEAVPRMIDKYSALAMAELGPDTAERVGLEVYRAHGLFAAGKLDESHAVLDSIRHETPIEKPRRVHVRVVDRDGAPVSGATVTTGTDLLGDSSRAAFAYGMGADVRIGKTDANGDLELETAATGIAVAELVDRRSAAVALADAVTLVLEPTSVLTGKVVLNGIAPSRVTIYVIDPTAPIDARHVTVAALRPDGAFEVRGVLRHRMHVSATLNDLAGGAFGNVDVEVDRPAVDGISLSVGGAQRTVHVLVRSTVGVPVAIANVTIYPGTVASSDARTMSTRTDAAAVASTKKVDPAKVAPAAKSLVHRDDQLATIDRVPAGAASACAMGYPRPDEMDAHTREQASQHLERIEVRCVPISETAEAVVIEVPPFPRFD